MIKRKPLVWKVQQGVTNLGPFKVYYFVGGTSIKIQSAA